MRILDSNESVIVISSIKLRDKSMLIMKRLFAGNCVGELDFI